MRCDRMPAGWMRAQFVPTFNQISRKVCRLGLLNWVQAMPFSPSFRLRIDFSISIDTAFHVSFSEKNMSSSRLLPSHHSNTNPHVIMFPTNKQRAFRRYHMVRKNLRTWCRVFSCPYQSHHHLLSESEFLARKHMVPTSRRSRTIRDRA